MNRVAFKIFSFNIYWYSIMIVIGILVAFMVLFREAKRLDINRDFLVNLVFYVILFGILGARLYYVLFNLDYYLSNPIEIVKVWNGGLAIHGGLIAGFIVTYIYCRKYSIRVLKIFDLFVVSVIIAQAIGRWGNFFNQEAYGIITSKEVLSSYFIPNFIIEGMFIEGAYYHPTFLYESLWNVVGFIIMLIFRRRKYCKVGQLTAFYLIWYSFGRFFIEHFRLDSLMLGNFKVAQIVSVISIVVGVVLFIISKKGSIFDNLYNQGEKNEKRF